MIFALLILAASLCWGQFPVDGTGWIITGLPAAQDSLLGPLIPSGKSPWIYGDLAEKGVADNMAPAALAETPILGTALSGTVSWTSATQTVTTTADLRTPLSGQSWVAFAWNSVDGAGSGRALCPIQSVTATTITCSENLFEPTSSGVTAYRLPPPDSHGWDFQSWTAENPTLTWNYYDVALALYRLYYRTGKTTYQTQARAYADITWQWTLDHGYRYIYPRAESMVSQFFRALDGHSERLPYLYLTVQRAIGGFGQFVTGCPYCDNREAGYALWWAALGAKTDPNPIRHAQYCSWLTTYVPYWVSAQQPDGSWGEREFALNASYVDAPKSYAAPFIFEAAPWREAINIKAMEAAYESLNDTSATGCNGPSTATAAMTSIVNAVTWANNYGRDTVSRGTFYEVNSQSQDQNTVGNPAGTVSINLNSTALTGVGTGWMSAGYCDGTHFIGIQSPNEPRTVYKIASCSSNVSATLTVAFGVFGETMNVSGSPYSIAPAASTMCNSLATYCFGNLGDRNLTRTSCGGIGWLYSVTQNVTYKLWADECISASLGGPTAGLTNADNIGSITLPCSGFACDGLVNDTVAAAGNCGTQAPPCVNGSYLYQNLGKNFGEAFGAPGIDNELAWRLLPSTGLTCDLNRDGAIDVLDVQVMINQVLGITACTNDLTMIGTCNVADVRRVVNAVLGGPCRIGP